MLRRLTSSFRNPFSKSFIFISSKPLIPQVFASFSTLSQTKNKASPFGKFKKHQEEIAKPKENSNKTEAVPSDMILSNTIKSCNQIIAQKSLLAKYDQDSIDVISQNLWTSYMGIKTIFSRRQLSKSNSNQKVNPLSKFLPNKIIQDTTILEHLIDLTTKLTRIYKANESQILKNPYHYMRAVTCFNRFETFHEQAEFWSHMYSIVRKLMARWNTLNQSEFNTMRSFLKVLSCHKYFCQSQTQTDLSAEKAQALEEVKSMEKDLFNYLMERRAQESLRGWMSLLFEFKLNKDDLLSELNNYFNAYLKDMKDLSDMGTCLFKASSFKNDVSMSLIFKQMKDILIEKAHVDKLSIDEINAVMFYNAQQNTEYPESEFSALWENLRLNISEKKTGNIKLTVVSSLMNLLGSSKYFTEERFALLEELAMTVFKEVQIVDLNKREKENKGEESLNEEDEENSVEENSDNKMTLLNLVSESVKMISAVAIYTKGTLNIDLLKQLVSTLRENSDKISKGNYTHVLMSCAKLLEKNAVNDLEFPIPKDLENDLANLFNQTFDKFSKAADLASAKDVTRVFHACCIRGKIDDSVFRFFIRVIKNKIDSLSASSCIEVLKALNDLKNDPITKKFAVDEELEKLILSKAKETLRLLSKEEFSKIVSDFNKLKSSKFIEDLATICRARLLELVRELKINQLASLMLKLHHVGMINEDFLNEVERSIIQNIHEATLQDISYIIHTYVDNNTMPAKLFKRLEHKTFFKLTKIVASKDHIDQGELNYIVSIFRDLAKSKFEDPKLLERFEEFFKEYLPRFDLTQLIQIVNGMGTYLSPNGALMKDIIKSINDMLFTEKNRNILTVETPSQAIQGFQHAMFTIRLEYKDTIDLDEYAEICKIEKHLLENIDKYRYRSAFSSKYQEYILSGLTYLKYEFKEEYPIGIYTVDAFISPDILVEISGPYHYINRSPEMVQRYQKKLRQLKKLGYRVAVVPYFEWDLVEKSGGSKYLKTKIESC